MKKRILSVFSAIIISLTLLVSAIPANAFTYNNNQLEEYAMRVVDLVNKLRAEVSAQDGIYRAPLQVLEPLCEAAQVRAIEQKDSYGHTRPDGTPFDTVLAEFNLASGWGSTGENCYKQITTPEAAMAGWTNSPGHYQNMINPSYNYIGVGVALINGTYYWTQFFLSEYSVTNLPTPTNQSITFNKSGLTNPFTVRAHHYEPGQSSFTYTMCFSVANESTKTAYFHGVTSKRVERVQVPETVVNPNNGKTYTVIYIGDGPTALTQNLALRQSIRYLVVPKSVISFSKRAFYNGSLISVRVEGPNTALRGIAERTFENCYELLSAGFQCCPNLDSIDKRAFYMCNSLGSINFAQNSTNIMFAYTNQTVFGANMHKTTLLFMPNNTNPTKYIDLFSTDKANWSSGKLKIYTSKSKVYENFDYLRAQNTTSTLKRVTPNS